MFIDLTILLLFVTSSQQFSETSRIFAVSEDAPVDTVIGSLELDSSKNYRIASISKNIKIDLQSGQISTAYPLDRELSANETALLVTQPAGVLHVTVQVRDINDNPPVFPLSSQKLSILETAAVGSRLPLLSAHDPDAGENGTIAKYSINCDDFEVFIENDVPFLELKHELDREKTDIYECLLEARDGGSPSRSSSVTVVIHVLDVNDCSPKFENNSMKVTWNGLASDRIAQLEVHDEDADENGQVELSVLDSPMFYFKENNLYSKLDHPSCCHHPPCSSCKLMIRATDGGQPPLSTTSEVEIEISTENKHDPQIQIRLQPSHVDFAVIERSAVIGRTIAVLTVTDEDGPLGEDAGLRVVDDDQQPWFRLDNKGGFYVFRLQRNASNIPATEYEVEFEGSDGQKPTRKTRKLLKVYIGSSSKLSIRQHQQVRIPEDAPIGSFVTTIQTNITDCRFSLKSSDVFTIDEINGIIVTGAELNLSIERHSVEVLIFLPPPSVEPQMVTVDVIIDDVNDHAPTIIIPTSVTVKEDASPGDVICNVTVVDEDKNQNGQVTTKVIGSARDIFSFKKGRLVLLRWLDFNEKSNFEVVIEATDGGDPPLSTKAVLRVEIVKSNRQPPEFPCTDWYRIINQLRTPGSIFNLPSLENRNVVYQLLDPTTEFSVNPKSGEVLATNQLELKDYSIRVRAVDELGNHSVNNVTVHFHVSESAPLPPPTVLQYTIAEETPLNTTIASLNKTSSTFLSTSAYFSVSNDGKIRLVERPRYQKMIATSIISSDPDEKWSTCLIFRIIRKPKAPHFEEKRLILDINRYTPLGADLAQVRAGSNLTYKTDCFYLKISSDAVITLFRIPLVNHVVCAVEAEDVWARKARLDVELRFSGIPKFQLNSSYSFSVKEHSRLGSVIGNLPNSRFHVYSSSLNSSIGIFPDGSVYVRRELLSVNGAMVILPVIVKDRHHGNQWMSTVYVRIEDINDHAPKCGEKRVFRLKENSPPGTVIGFFEATDEDFGLNSVVKYSIISPQKLFSIEPATGKIIALSEFDAELIDNTTVKIKVSDLKELSTVCEVVIQIEDVNEFDPYFLQKFYRFRLNSSSSIVGSVSAKEIDRDNQSIMYRLRSHYSFFDLNANSGLLTIKRKLPPGKRLNVSVEAIDDGNRIGRAFLLIDVDEDPSTQPEFLAECSFSLPSTARAGYSIGRILATAGTNTVRLSISDDRFSIDSFGYLILMTSTGSKLGGGVDLHVTARTDGAVSHQNCVINVIPEAERNFVVQVNDLPKNIVRLPPQSKIFRIFPESEAFQIENDVLRMEIPRNLAENNKFEILISEQNKTWNLYSISIDQRLSDFNCINQTFVIDRLPAQIQLNCSNVENLRFEAPRRWKSLGGGLFEISMNCSNVENLRFEAPRRWKSLGGGLFEISLFSEIIENVEIRAKGGSKSLAFQVTVIHNKKSSAVDFSSKSYSLLMSSSLEEGQSFGRITADANVPVEYFLIGPSVVSVDRTSGALLLSKKKELFKFPNLIQALLIAASNRGVATVNVSIEVIEDSLAISPGEFVFELGRSGGFVGVLAFERTDIKLHLDHPNFYLKDGDQLYSMTTNELKTFPVVLDITVTKGRLARIVKVFLVPQAVTVDLKKFEFWVQENKPSGTIAGFLGAEGYSIFGDVPLLLNKNGFLKTTNSLDHEKKAVYTFKVLENGEEKEAILVVDDENDCIPEFEQEFIEVEVYEDVFVGQKIAQLKWKDDDLNNAFNLQITDGDFFNNFAVHNDGSLTIMNELDWELMTSYRLTVELRDGAAPYEHHSINCTIKVTVLDANDNPPKFKNQKFVFLASENAALGTIIGQIQASDPDSGAGGRFAFRILPETLPNAEFLIDPIDGRILVNTNLDFEQRTNYSFTVSASDFGETSLESVAEVDVQVIDVNDHVPHFVEGSMTIYIDETLQKGTVIHRLEIEDADSYPNYKSVFFTNSSMFKVRELSGEVVVDGFLDFEKQKEHLLFVFARNIVDGESTNTTLTIRLNDLNDEKPRFIDGFPVNIEVYEDISGPFPTIIGSSVSEDDDDGINGVLAYSILHGNSSLFSVNASTGDILLLQALDREEQEVHELTVMVEDTGRPRLSSTADIKIRVLDKNDNSPQFSQPFYAVRIAENVPLGTEVIRLNATDADIGENAKISYKILDPHPFYIESDGIIRVSGLIDREENSKYKVEVLAFDSGRFVRKNSSVFIYIDVEDQNDNSPMIRNNVLDVHIDGRAQKGDVVYAIDVADADDDFVQLSLSGPDSNLFAIHRDGSITSKSSSLGSKTYSLTVSATDGVHSTSASFSFYATYDSFPKFIGTAPVVRIDEGTTGDVHVFKAIASTENVVYEILANNDGSFEIDRITGVLRVKKALDREEKAVYRLWVAASDTGLPPRTSLQSIEIRVVDVNDNEPIFKEAVYYSSVPENAAPQKILSINATDADIGENARLAYKIKQGNLGNAFAIDGNGVITSTKELDREEISRYELLIEAQDQGSPQLSGFSLIKIEILDEDDNGPKFSRLFKTEVYEDIPINSSVIQIEASDPDSTVGNLTFSIVGGNGPFDINPITGMIYLKSVLDREDKSRHRLRVQAQDSSWSIFTTVTILVLDVNDNSPIFDKDQYLVIAEDNSTGRIHAVDVDSGMNGEVRYTLEKDNPFVLINSSTGEIIILRAPETGFLILTVIAIDNGMPARSNRVNVTVIWTFSRGTKKTFSICPEDQKFDIIGILEIGPHTQSQIFSDILALNGSNVLLKHSNITNSKKSSLLQITENSVSIHEIELVQIYKREPLKFSEERYLFTVLEDAEIGSYVGRVELNSEENVLFDSSSNLFSIRNGGWIHLMRPLDYGTERSHVFHIRANSSKSTATTNIEIKVLDSDDHDAHFDSPLSITILSENLQNCISATDDDESPYDLTEYSTTSEDFSIDSDSGCLTFNAPTSEGTIIVKGGRHVEARALNIIWMTDRPIPLPTQSFFCPINNGNIFTAHDSCSQGRQEVFQKTPFTKKILRTIGNFTFTKNIQQFEKKMYNFNVPSNARIGAIIHDFGSKFEGLEARIKEYSEIFCLTPKTTLFLCGLLRKQHSPYIFHIELHKDLNLVGKVRVLVTVKPETSEKLIPDHARIREKSKSRVAQLTFKDDDSYQFSITDRNLENVFGISEDGILVLKHDVDANSASSFRIPILAAGRRSRRSMDFELYLDPVARNRQFSSELLVTTVGISKDEVIGYVGPSQKRKSKAICDEQRNGSFELSATCILSVQNAISPLSIPVKSGNMSYTIKYRHIVPSDSLPTSKIVFSSYSSNSEIADFLTTLAGAFTDLDFMPFVITSEEVGRSILLSIVDRNGHLVSAQEASSVLNSFISKRSGINPLIRNGNGCEYVECPSGFHCDLRIERSGNRLNLRGERQIWSIPPGNEKLRCCPLGGCGKSTPQSSEKTCQHCIHGLCVEGKCICHPGYEGTNCSDQVTLSALTTIPATTLSSNPVVIPVISTSFGFLEMISHYSSTPLSSVQLEFRSLESDGILLKIIGTRAKATIELEDWRPILRISSSGNPMNIQLVDLAQEQKWHKLQLDIDYHMKTIRFQLDGVGKSATARFDIPELKITRMIVGSDDESRLLGCLKNLKFNNKPVSFEAESFENFTLIQHGHVFNQCPVKHTPVFAISTVAALLGLIIILLAVIVVTVWKIYAKWCRRKARGWQDAQKEISTVNCSMPRRRRSTPEESLYDVVMDDNYHQAQTLAISQAHLVRTVADVKLNLPITAAYKNDAYL